MAKRGRKPVPEALKILSGTRADRLNPSAPAGNPARPECPAHLDDEAREEWERMVALLERLGVLAETDGAALAIFCAMHSRRLEALTQIEVHGFLVESAMGSLKANPAVGMVAKCEAAMIGLLAEFGCTPSSRSRLKSSADKPQDALGEFLRKRKGS